MKVRIKFSIFTYLFFLVSLLINSNIYGQSGCLNADFSLGNFSNWTGSTGLNSAGNYNNIVPGIVNGRHTIISTAGTDPNTGGGLSLLPPGGTVCARLGNDNWNYEAERLSYTLAVTALNCIFTYQYAVVLEDPSHPTADQPKFTIYVKDGSGNVVDPTCGIYEVSASGSIPGFNTYGSIRWKNWTTVGIDLSAYIGQNITIEFTTYDCAQGAHFGYAYIACSCGSLQLSQQCLGTSSVVTAPPGFSTYSWSTGQTTQSVTYNNPVNGTVVSVTCTSVQGCSVTLQTTLSVNPPVFTVNTPAPICAGQSATLSVTGTESYTWSTGGTGNSVSVSPSTTTTYTVTATTSGGCSDTEQLTVTVNAIPIADAGTPQSICPGGSATLTASGGGTYQWNTGASTQSINVSPGSTTAYTVTVSNNGCTATDNVTVTVNSSIVADAGLPQTVCPGYSATLTATGGGTYAWSEGSSTASITVSPASTTTYTVTVTNLGCSGTDNVTVTVSSSITPDAGAPQTICSGQSVVLTASGGSTYAWSEGSSTASISVSPLSTTTYSVTVSSGGCSGTDNVTVTVNPTPPANAGTDQIICSGQSANLTAFGGGTYLWSNSSTNQSTNVSPAVTSLYTVTVTSSGCTATDDVQVTVNSAPVASAGPDQAICVGGSTNLSASGGISYIWSPVSDLSNSMISNPVASPPITTTYAVTVTDANGCSATDDMILSVNPLPTANAGPDQTICDGNIANLGASGGVSYNWSPATGLNFSNIANPDASPAITTNYIVSITDANGCTGSDDVTITVNPIPTSSFTAVSPVCVGNSSTITYTGSATPSANYSWNFNGGTIISGTGQGPYQVSWGNAGSYTITLSVSENNCTSPVTSIPVVVGQVTASLAVTDSISCYGSADGEVTASASGQPVYSYLWSNGQTGMTATGLDANTLYSVTITDNNGCTTAPSISLIQPQPLTMVFTTQDVDCYNGNNGIASVFVSGGTTSYQYAWSPPSIAGNVNSVSTLQAGTYSLSITDLHGCNLDTTFTINQPPQLTYTYSTDSVNCFGGSDGSIVITPSGGTPPLIYNWNPSVSTGSSAYNLSSGLYLVTITDNNGCDTTAFITVDRPPQITMNISPDVTICIGQSTNISVSASGGTGTLIFNWDNGLGIGNSFNVNPTTTTTYTVSVTDANGCTTTPQSITVSVNPPISVSVVANPTSLCLGQSSQLTATANGGNGNYTYTWGAGIGISGSSITVTPTTTTMYPVTVTDNCGSPAGIDSVEVIVYPLPLVQFVSDTISGCEPLLVNFTDLSTPSIGSWLWDFGDPSSGANNTSTLQNPTHVYSDAGIYTVTLTVTTTDGCSGSYTHQNMIEVYITPIASFTTHPPTASTQDPLINFYDLSSDAYYWDWNFGEPSSSENTSTDANPTHSYGNAGTYTITLIVESMYGCTDTTQQEILITQDFSIFVPNGFTPNGDGENDGFYAEGEGIDPNNFEMYIYDRWGEMVFKTNDFYEPWDGRVMHGEKIAPIAVYSWIIFVKDLNGEPYSLIGRVTLVR